MIPLLYYLSIFLGSSTALFFSVKLIEGDFSNNANFPVVCITNSILIILAKILILIPSLGIILAVLSIIFTLKNIFKLTWVHAILVFLIQVFSIGGIKALFAFFLAGYLPMI